MRGFGPQRKKGIFCLIAAFLLLLAGLVALDRQLSPVVEQVADNRVRLQINEIVNSAVEQAARQITYQDLIQVEKDAQDNVTLLHQNTAAINGLITDITLAVNNGLDNLAAEGVQIPLGLLSGVTMFASLGPSLQVDIQPVGSVTVEIKDDFTSVGLNQSRHTLSLASTVSVSLLLPFRQQLVEVNNTFPLTDSIIVGPLPETYLQFR